MNSSEMFICDFFEGFDFYLIMHNVFTRGFVFLLIISVLGQETLWIFLCCLL